MLVWVAGRIQRREGRQAVCAAWDCLEREADQASSHPEHSSDPGAFPSQCRLSLCPEPREGTGCSDCAAGGESPVLRRGSSGSDSWSGRRAPGGVVQAQLPLLLSDL